MTLDYGRPAPPEKANHDHIYTTLLGVLGFFVLIGMVSLMRISKRLKDSDGKAVISLVLGVEGCFLGAIVVGLVIRLAFPPYRRWPTFGLNIILLMLVPLGTVLGIYGLRKVDRRVS